MAEGTAAAPPELRYGGYSRFELELEVGHHLERWPGPVSLTVSQFVQCLANPQYLNYLASQKIFDDSEFIAYLDYLQYFKEPKYARYLSYVG